MDQRTFIHRIAKAMDADTRQTSALADTLADTITDMLADCDKVAIPGFGTFSAVKTDEHETLEPGGVRVLMPPSIHVTFEAGSRLRKAATPHQ